MDECWMMKRLFVAVLALFALPASTFAQKLDVVPRTVVMTAYEPEWAALVDKVHGPKTYQINGLDYVTGTMSGKPVLLMLSGVSIVNASMTTQIALERFQVKRIVFSGVAGGVDPALSIGDVIVPDTWGQYLEVSFARRSKGRWAPPEPIDPRAPASWEFMFPRGVAVRSADRPWSREFLFPVDPALLELARKVVPTVKLSRCVEIPKLVTEIARSEFYDESKNQSCLPKEPKIVVGGVGVTAGVYADNAKFRQYLFREWKARALDMESAAVAQVAYANQVPTIFFRSLSDLAGGDEVKNASDAFERLASVNVAQVVLAYIEALPD
jgi:adenosylhomocysteine nucleosidase